MESDDWLSSASSFCTERWTRCSESGSICFAGLEVESGYTSRIANFHARWNRPWGGRNSLTRCEQDLNQWLQHEGWRVTT